MATAAPQFPTHLETPRLALSPVQADDGELLHDLWNQPAVRAALWRGHALSHEQSREMAARSAWLHQHQGHGLWAARARDGGQLVGFGGFWFVDPAEPAELLYALHRAYWGQGLGGELVHALIVYAWSALGLDEIRASTEPGNAASAGLLRRFGFNATRDGLGGLQTWRLRPSRSDDSWGV